jgi:tryptophan synthase beta chain
MLWHIGVTDVLTLVTYVLKLAPSLKRDQIVVINLSGRGDKDVPSVAAQIGVKL